MDFDKIKDKLEDAKDKLSGVLGEHGDKVEGGIDKAADFVDDKTGGKYSEKIDDGAEQAKGLLDKLDGDDPKP